MAEFLFEIGLEEIPARMIAAAESELARRVAELLQREDLLAEGHAVTRYSTPRRLAVLVTGVKAAQADREEQLTGPAWSIAFKDGQPTPAAQAFAKKAGVEVAALQKVTTPKGEYVGASSVRKGRAANEILLEALPKEIAAIYWPKNMYWRAGKPERFVRPVQWMVALLGEQVIPVEFAGVTAANVTYGHRILHGDAPVAIPAPMEYAATLEAAKVQADVEARRHRIRKALDHVTRTVPGARWREDEALVDAVTHLTEWPSVLLGSFETEFLALPEEVLVTVMRDHQKYFAVEDAAGKLAPHFLTALNTEPSDQAAAIIRHGNERVLRARFNDARFFWTVDQKISLANRLEMLQSVTFHKELGSYHQKTHTTREIAVKLSAQVRHAGTSVDEAALLRAVELAKTDLTTELVKEFTELQGIVGGLYARAQGEGEAVAQAIYWQYSPASMDDPIPPTLEGQLLGLADRIGTIVEMFAIGLEPTGSKDPFALRRAANAVVKILAEGKLPVTLDRLLNAAEESSKVENAAASREKVMAFLKERLEFYMREVLGYRYDVVNAVLAAGAHDVVDTIARAEALSAVRGSEDFAAIAAAFKRSKNILRQAAEKAGVAEDSLSADVDAALLPEPAEKQLHEAAAKLAPVVEELRAKNDYRAALEQIATLRPQVDLFFDKVMVMVEDDLLRHNRLALIQYVLRSFSSIADFSEIVAS
ncbi:MULTISPECIES: glycine--tRNA ligase subunit beta [Acidobacterium]|uniref:Glycine--tRNA ligase beta subunit n=1 Tax=Acidobacterium capsulatum (strain ATCC 51196 / DSM 11244 / BCRC 80197 / JCM 7670 / NBRC 15755 / NCIMB 13165 / 161) TaxID=240015 RepID=SYGB_ACIC5|nr:MULTISPECIES: glycine--tRNA ligase subunit beta [Acidobacterium]C1F1J0.1 RecName: Full=Glycine--tRNA ligase beta subunit; AltName: Full=Glycyl-tRNA synthetase beta subunit; Short=GlyRS [Acidobacterium capsulatum ATCC 51196]ACO32145.1 glycyl-tRNA synthetase, beta subunit [Acidobacterium capsulatum ATCC 51196]HCT61388.1 glycine--tRNA ligase subunit beta [Acidobacterium sp.]